MPRKPGRKAELDPPVLQTLSLPSSLVTEIKLRLHDPVTRRVRYGTFSALVERLLREWLQSQQL